MSVDDAFPTTMVSCVAERERAFWGDHVPGLDQCLREYESGPDPSTARMLQAVEPLAGRRVLDFGCGAGVTSAWLAHRGATVTGIDISPASIERVRELAQRAGLAVELIAGELTPSTFPAASFDAVVGRYVLHHIDLGAIAPTQHVAVEDYAGGDVGRARSPRRRHAATRYALLKLSPSRHGHKRASGCMTISRCILSACCFAERGQAVCG